MAYTVELPTGCRDELLRRLFASPRDVTALISWRDALDRTERLSTPDEAAALLRRARMSGDELLVKAIGMRAADCAPTSTAWAAVLDEWAADDEGRHSALAELGIGG